MWVPSLNVQSGFLSLMSRVVDSILQMEFCFTDTTSQVAISDSYTAKTYMGSTCLIIFQPLP